MTVKIDGSTGVDKVQPDSVDKEDLKWVPPFTKEYVSPEQTITNNSSMTLLHGLGKAYKLCTVALKCVTADLGYVPGDEVEMGVRQDHSTGAYGFNRSRSGDTGITIKVLSIDLYVHSAGGTSLGNTITPANWRLIVRAWA